MASMQQQPEVKSKVQTSGEIKNSVARKNQLQLADSKNWSGSMVTAYPKLIANGQIGKFVQEGPLPNGSKGAFIYADSSTPTPRKWLVAYHTPAQKVYAEAGTKISNWDNVLSKLNSGRSTIVVTDPEFGGRVEAGIMPNGNLYVTFAS